MDRNDATPARVVDLRDTPAEGTTPRHRAEDVLPGGFVPSHLAAPMLRDTHATQLEYAAMELGGIRLAADLIATGETLTGDQVAAQVIADTATRVQRLLRALAAGALVALVAVGLSVGGARPAAAATVPASVSASVGAMESPEPDSPITQHPTRFGRGSWFDQCNGDLFVVAPLAELVPTLGWLPSPWEKVVVQEQTKRGVRTRATLTRTTTEGLARGLVHIGGGVHMLRVVHPADLWTLGTSGTWRRVVVTTEPCDVV